MVSTHLLLAGALALTAANSCALAQAPAARLRKPIDEAQVVTPAGNVHPLARAEFDLGAVGGETRLDRILLFLKPSATQEAALDALVEAQHNPKSPLFHYWLTPDEYAVRFGIPALDVAKIAGWLEGHGFSVEHNLAGGRLIVFSGTADQVAETFHTGMHRYRVNGALHLANTQDPQIPAALAGVVGGIVSLHDFRRVAAISSHKPLGARAQWNLYGSHYMYPADYAAIYNLNPLYDAGTAGAGVSIAIAGRSNIDLSDVAAFRTASGLSAKEPQVILVGADPGLVAGDQDEATLDVEWSGAVATEATVKLVAAKSTATSDGVDLAAAYIVSHALAQVVSVSYGNCEAAMGATELAFYNSLWQQAASQGMSVFVASGDSGAAGCDVGSSAKGTEAAVNGLCSSPYSTCVGGTEFDEGSNDGQYWKPTNGPGQGSATGYIPETVWNESAANGGYGLWASGGGVSSVYAQPVWQQAVSGAAAANGMRAVPDVSMSTAGHDGYIIYENGSNWIVSGTSAATPSLAGVMAIVVESKGDVGQGNPNVSFYGLASAGNSPFHTTQAGNNGVPGVAGFTASGVSYNLATGLGSVDGALLVKEWGAAVAPVPTLSLAVESNSAAVYQRGSTTISLTASTGGSFSGAVTLSVTGLPSGVLATFSGSPVNSGTGWAMLTLTAAPNAEVGGAPVMISAKGDGLTATQIIQVQVRPFPFRTRRRVLPIYLPVKPPQG